MISHYYDCLGQSLTQVCLFAKKKVIQKMHQMTGNNVCGIDFIKPICLPTDSSLRSKNYEGINLEVAGWGKTETGKKTTLSTNCRNLLIIFFVYLQCHLAIISLR